MLQWPLFTDTAGGILSTQVYRESFLRSFRSYFYAQKYSLNKDVLCTWLNAGNKMVNKFRGGFLRFVAEWGISSQHVILLSVCCYTLSVKQWANSSYNHNIQENMIGKELEGRHFGQTKESSQRLWWEGFWPVWSRGQGAQGLAHLWSLRVQSFKFKSRLSGHLKLYLSQQEDKTSFSDLLPWSVLSEYSEVYQVGLSYVFAPYLNTVRSWLQRVVLKVMIY